MKRFFFLLFFAIGSTIAMQIKAETPLVQMLEGEIRAGLTAPLGGYHTGKAQVSGAIGIEGRYNFRGTHGIVVSCLIYQPLAEVMNIYITMAMTDGKAIGL